MLSQILCPALTCPGPFCHIIFFWWKELTGECTGDMHSLGSLSGPADHGASLGFTSGSTWSKPGCGPGGTSKEKATWFCPGTKEEMNILGATDWLKFCLCGLLRLWSEKWWVYFEISPSTLLRFSPVNTC